MLRHCEIIHLLVTNDVMQDTKQKRMKGNTLNSFYVGNKLYIHAYIYIIYMYICIYIYYVP